MRVTLVRNATVIVEIAGRRVLVDPMLDDAGARPPIEGTHNPVPNPTVPLPFPADDVVRDLDAVIGVDGSVRDITVTKSAHPALDASAIEAVRRAAGRVLREPADRDGVVQQVYAELCGSRRLRDSYAATGGSVVADAHHTAG